MANHSTAEMGTPRRVLIVGGGGIAAANLPHLAAAVIGSWNCTVTVVLTSMARRFVSAETLTHITGCAVHGEEWADPSGGALHVALSLDVDLVIVYPATQALAARIALGLTTDLASATVANSEAPVLIAPSFPAVAFRRASTQRLLTMLSEDGYVVAPTACAQSVTTGRIEPGGALPIGELITIAAEVHLNRRKERDERSRQAVR